MARRRSIEGASFPILLELMTSCKFYRPLLKVGSGWLIFGHAPAYWYETPRYQKTDQGVRRPTMTNQQLTQTESSFVEVKFFTWKKHHCYNPYINFNCSCIGLRSSRKSMVFNFLQRNSPNPDFDVLKTSSTSKGTDLQFMCWCFQR